MSPRRSRQVIVLPASGYSVRIISRVVRIGRRSPVIVARWRISSVIVVRRLIVAPFVSVPVAILVIVRRWLVEVGRRLLVTIWIVSVVCLVTIIRRFLIASGSG